MEWYLYSESSTSDDSKVMTYRPKGVTFEDEDVVEVIVKTSKVLESTKAREPIDENEPPIYKIEVKIEVKYIVANGKNLTEYSNKDEAFKAAEELLKK